MDTDKDPGEEAPVTGELDGISAMRAAVGLDKKDKEEKEKVKTDHGQINTTLKEPEKKEPEKKEPEDDDPFTLKLKEIRDRKKKEKEDEENVDGKELKKPKTKEENIAALRKSRDELKKKYEELEANGSPMLKPVGDLLTRETGGLLTEKSVSEFVETYETMKERVVELENQLGETESSLKDISIKSSRDWKEGYEKPYFQARSVLTADLMNLDSTGQPKNEKLINEFTNGLIAHVEKAGEVDMIAVKASMKQFGVNYKELTGEDYDAPSARDVNASLNEVLRMQNKASNALTEWEKEKEERDNANSFERRQKEQEETAAGKRERFKAATDSLNQFDLDAIDGIFEPSQITEVFNDTFKGNEKAIENAAEAPSYAQVLELQAKGNLFDKLLEKYKEAISEVKEVKEEKTSGRYGSDILGREIKHKDSSKNPLGEMRASAGLS